MASNDCDIEFDILNYNLLGYLFKIFDISINIFYGMYYPTLHRVIIQITIFILYYKNIYVLKCLMIENIKNIEKNHYFIILV